LLVLIFLFDGLDVGLLYGEIEGFEMGLHVSVRVCKQLTVCDLTFCSKFMRLDSGANRCRGVKWSGVELSLARLG
jgi:hypothetical protein